MFSGRKLPLTLAFVVLIALAFGASCKGFFVDPTLSSITVGPTSGTVQKDATLQMAARGTYDDGSYKTITNSVLWTSSDTSVATISSTGLVTGITTSGTTTITAEKDTVQGTATVDVVLTGVTGITITPTSATIARGDSGNFICNAAVTGTGQVDITTVATWTVSDTTNTTFTTSSSPAVLTIGDGATIGETITLQATYTVDSTTYTSNTVTVTVK